MRVSLIVQRGVWFSSYFPHYSEVRSLQFKKSNKKEKHGVELYWQCWLKKPCGSAVGLLFFFLLRLILFGFCSLVSSCNIHKCCFFVMYCNAFCLDSFSHLFILFVCMSVFFFLILICFIHLFIERERERDWRGRGERGKDGRKERKGKSNKKRIAKNDIKN